LRALLVVGGSGQIGGWLLRHLACCGHEAVGTYATRIFPGLRPLDALDREATSALIAEVRPDVVFYPAGFTWVDGSERDPEKAYGANLHQPLGVAEAAANSGARFVYCSTDYVFDGVDGPSAEDDATRPLFIYGEAKCDAEAVIGRTIGDRALTARNCWVYGPERQGKNFAYQLVRTLSQGKSMTCPADQISSPSYGPDVAEAVVRLVEAEASGLIHVVGPEVVDRPTFARAVVRAFGLDETEIEAKPTAEIGQGAPRPLKSGLSIGRLEAVLPGLMKTMDRALADFRSRLDAPEMRGWIEPAIPSPAT